MFIVWSNRVAIALAVIAIFISINLWLSHMLMKELPCTDAKGCASVAASPLSRVFGIPIAAYGALFDLFVIGVCLWRVGKQGRVLYTATVVLWTMVTIAMAISVILLYLGYASLHVVCDWCAAHASAIVLLWMVATTEFWFLANREGAELAWPREWKVIGGLLGIGLVATAGYAGTYVLNAPVMRVITVDNRPEILRPGNWSRGPDDAPVTIVVFSDFQCQSCINAANLLHQLLEQYPETLREVYRHRALYKIHPNAQVLSEIAEWAGSKGKFWEMHDAIFAKPELGMQGNFLPYARVAGLDPDELERFLKQQRTQEGSEREAAFRRTLQDQVDAEQLGVDATPTFFVVLRYPDGKVTTERTSSVAGLKRFLEEPHVRRLLGPARKQ